MEVVGTQDYPTGTSKHMLRRVIITKWNNVSSEETSKLVQSMPERLNEVLRRKGSGQCPLKKNDLSSLNPPGVKSCILSDIPECDLTKNLTPQGHILFRCFKCQRFGHSKTNCRGILICARCAVAGHESTDCTAVEKCVNCQGKHTSFSRSCPKWTVEKEIVATKFKNNMSFPEARRIVKAQSPPDGKSYASVVDKSHPVYQTTHCPHCNHAVTMSNPVPSTSKSADPIAIASSSGTKNKNILAKSSSQTSAVPPDSQDSSGFIINSVALRLADRGIVHKDLLSIFGGVLQVPDLKLHPSDEDEYLQMNCDESETPLVFLLLILQHFFNGYFLSWNCRGIRSKLQDLKGLINIFNPVCIGLQKTFLSPNIPLKPRGYNSVRKVTATGSNHSDGVCILNLTSNLFPSTPLNLHTSLQAVAVQIHVRTLVTVFCVYLPPHDIINRQDLDTLVDQLPTPFILLGDFNGYSTLWGSDVTNSRGRQIERLISNNCLCLLNNGEKTYFHEPTRTFHSLDLAICSPTLLPLLHFTVGSDICNSDHFPIIVSYADSGGAVQYPPRYIFQQADWGNFIQLADITESMVSTADITETVQNVVDCLINAAINTIPKSSPRLRKFRRPWWNEACRDSRREEKKL
ncbi:hypothetical protein AVEN_78761-1 [Araneus ventricosus]|uniref:CCHC-type domain-containing protein n=1 Tax=Araneus ventricosus TaxID=182803 RepID=A0A4Y2NU08_ARAVE|nr:hypothetical protein AVEN_78761-1 [Araneus ventricosus]